MLDIVRNLVSSLFGKVLLGLMVLSFALWGVGDILTSGNSRLAAKIGTQKITLEEFYNKFQKSITDLNRASGGQITVQQARNEKIDMLVINEMVYKKMVLEYANKKGIHLNDNTLKEIIINLPQFKNIDDKFSEKIYQSAIKNNFFSEEDFLNEISFVYLNGLLFENYNSNYFVNNEIIDLLYEFESQTRNIEYFLYDKENIKVEISDKEINDYYDNNSSNYKVKEERNVDYLTINLDDYKSLISIPNEVSFNYYDENIDLYKSKEKRNIEIARFTDIDKAENFKDKWITLNENDLNDYVDLHSIEINKIDAIERNNFPEEVSKNIFELEAGQMSDPIEIEDIGYYVVKNIKIFPESLLSYEEAKDGIIEEMSYDDAYQLYDDAINLADELLLNAYDLEEIAAELELSSISNSENIINRKIPLEKFIDNFKNTESLDQARNQELNYISDIMLNDDNAYIYKISNITNSYIPKLQDIYDLIKSDLKDIKVDEMISASASQFLINNQFKGYSEFKSIVNNNNFNLIELNNVDRNYSNNDLTEKTINEIFQLNINNIYKFKNRNNQYGILYVKDIISPKDKISESFYRNVSNNIKSSFNSSIENLLGDRIIEEIQYEIFIQNINNVLS